MIKTFIFALALPLVMMACSNTPATGESATQQPIVEALSLPTFNADTAYQFTARQCAMGSRVPGTEAHRQCAQWLATLTRQWCDSTVVQHGEVTTFDGTRLDITNVVGIVNPAATRRLLLLTHWDCRPWADSDPDPARRRDPVMGANDGASGTAVLLELARIMHDQHPDVGIDLLFTDAEDWGDNDNEDSWALGTQYWLAHPHVDGYAPEYGILLDMVGAAGARFGMEYFSLYYAGDHVRQVWAAARQAGHERFFVDDGAPAITDDHVPVNCAGIPCIDIIDTRTSGGHSFFPAWHTTADTMDNIDAATLRAVGETLVRIIYNMEP